jgi:hypothetical protein
MLSAQDAAVVKGMIARGDKQHDIAAYFGQNGARIAEIKKGERHPDVKPAPITSLPPPAIPRAGHFVDPKAPLEIQIEQLQTFIRNQPENGRVITFSPKLSDWINTNLNNNNRRKRPRNIQRFAEAMTAGEWTYTGDTVKFSKEGVLLDGQNRFAASVRSGKAFKTLAVFGIAQEAFAKIDTNAVRTNADTMEIVGVPHSRTVASAVRWLMIGQDRGRQITNTELHDYYREHIDPEEIQLAARRAIAAGRILPLGSLTALLYQFEHKSKKAAESFAADLAHRKRGGRTLIARVQRLREQNMGRVNELQQQAMIILAWNAYRSGSKITAPTLMWNDNKEFPAIA